MSIVYFLLPVSLGLGLFFVISFLWATKKGQYDDLDTPSQRILLDDVPINNKNKDIHKKVN